VPDGRFVDADGQTVDLADFRGKVVLLNFWATWCGPCKREMPDLDRLQAKLGGERFQVVALSSDRQGPAVVGPFYDELGVGHLTVFNDRRGAVQRAFGVFGLPTTVLIDPQGRELGRLVGPADWGSPEAQALVERAIADAGS
jgi:thiol-disulfide isomerase/thioredoxin